MFFAIFFTRNFLFFIFLIFLNSTFCFFLSEDLLVQSSEKGFGEKKKESYAQLSPRRNFLITKKLSPFFKRLNFHYSFTNNVSMAFLMGPSGDSPSFCLTEWFFPFPGSRYSAYC